MFDWEYGIDLHAMKGNRASSPGEGYVSWDFSSCGRNLGYILELQRGWPFETPLGSGKAGFLSSYVGHLRKLTLVWQDNTDASGGEVGDQESLPIFHRDIGIVPIFKKRQASSPFEALNSLGLSSCQAM